MFLNKAIDAQSLDILRSGKLINVFSLSFKEKNQEKEVKSNLITPSNQKVQYFEDDADYLKNSSFVDRVIQIIYKLCIISAHIAETLIPLRM